MTEQEAIRLLQANANFFRNVNNDNIVIVDGVERIVTTAVIQEPVGNFRPVVFLDGNIRLDLEDYLNRMR